MKAKNNISALAKRFLQFAPSSKMESFDAFLEKKKKRRGGWFWLLFGAIIICGGLYGQYFYGQEKTTAKQVKAKAEQVSTLEFAGENRMEAQKMPVETNSSAKVKEDYNSSSSSDSSFTGKLNPDRQEVTLIEPELIEPTDDPSSVIWWDTIMFSKSGVEFLFGFENPIKVLPRSIKQLKDSTEKTRNDDTKWMIGITASYINSNQTTEASREDANNFVHKDYLQYVSESENPAQSLAFGLRFAYQGWNIATFTTGFNYYQYGSQGNFDFKVDSMPFYGQDGTILFYMTDSSGEGVRVNETSNQTLTYIAIPIGLGKQFKLGDSWSIGVQTALKFEFLMGAGGRGLSEQDISQTQPLNKEQYTAKNLSYSVELGLYRKLNRNWQVGLSASLFRQRNSVAYGEYFETQNRANGLGLSLNYHF